MQIYVSRFISILSRKHAVYLNQVLKPFDLTSAEYPILMYLYHHEHVTQEEICQYFNIDKGALARTIQSLLEKDYITKMRSEKDKRYFIVSLTDKARAIKDDVLERLHYWNEFITQDFDEATLQQLLTTLELMMKRIESVNSKEWREFFENR